MAAVQGYLEQMYIIFFVPPYALNTEQPNAYVLFHIQPVKATTT